MQIYQVLKSRQPSYLADPDWVELPWKTISKTPFDQLLDITATLANLFVQASEIEGLESTGLLSAALGVVKHCWKIDDELGRFYENFERENRGSLYWPAFSTEDNPADDAVMGKVFPVAFQFSNLQLAFTCMIYWASSILLWAILSRIYELLGTLQSHNACQLCSEDNGNHDTCNAPHFDTGQVPPMEPRIDVLAAARNICQSIEYCMQEEMKGVGPAATVIPLLAVIELLANFPQCSRELSWAKSAFARLFQRGYRLMTHIGKEYGHGTSSDAQ